MRNHRLILGLVFLLFISGLASSPVSAEEAPDSTDVCLSNCTDSATPIVENEISFESSGSGSQSAKATSRPPSWLDACEWQYWPEGTDMPDNSEMFNIHTDLGKLPIGTIEMLRDELGEEEAWLMLCDPQTVASTPAGIYSVVGRNNIPQHVLDAVIQEAYDQTPVVAMYPAASPSGSDDVPFVTRLPTWLWVDEADWVSVSATSSIPPLTVTSTATPVKTVWSGGHEPESIECDQGTPFLVDVDEDAQSTDCEMSWIHSSDVEDFSLDLDVVWEVSYTCSAVCGEGSLPAITTSSVRPVRVAEVQNLIS